MKHWLQKLKIPANRRAYYPPPGLQFVGPADFFKVGEKFKQLFIEWGGLKPEHRVLDVGSGNGRMAFPLLEYLADDGDYIGQEIVPEAVQWCRKTYRRHENFMFIHANIRSQRYHPQGKLKAREYRFPLSDNDRDFVFLTSVFTHMLQADVEHYSSEIARILKPGGRCFITCFLVNPAREKVLEEKSCDKDFQPLEGASFTTSPENPESAMAFTESYFLNFLATQGLQLVGEIHYGRWCGDSHATSYQDVIVLEKR